MVEWIDEEELLDKSIGDIREMLAHEDSDSSFRAFLIENGWISDTDNIYNDEDEEDWNEDEEEDEEEDYEDEDYEDEEDWEEDDDIIELPSDQENLAQQVARDITSGTYTIDTICSFYSADFISRVEQLID